MRPQSRTSRPATTAALACLLAGTMAHAASLDVPFGPDTSWTFLVGGYTQDMGGEQVPFGPEISTFQVAAVDLPIFDHTATLAEVVPGQPLPEGGGAYYLEQPNGVFIVSDANPNLNQWYEYYTDPKPFLVTDLIDPETGLNFEGTWRGQWETFPGSGVYEPWEGIWTASYTSLGIEIIRTPLGVFSATHIRESEYSTKSPLSDPSHVSTSLGITDWYVIEGLTVLRVLEVVEDASDYDGDGEIDWRSTTRTERALIDFELIPGDTDADGDIDDADLGTVISNFTGPFGIQAGKTHAQGDTNGDGDVDDGDLGTVISGFTGPLAPASVPEPAAAWALALSGAFFGARHHRQQTRSRQSDKARTP